MTNTFATTHDTT